MTTIAANRKVMAADSMVSDDCTDVRVQKLHILGSGAVVGIAGTLEAAAKFIEYMEGMGKVKRPKFNHKDFEAVLLTAQGLYLYDNSCRALEVTEGFIAIGTGTQAAMAKLREGGGPVAAVRHACRADKNSKPPIATVSVAALKRRRG